MYLPQKVPLLTCTNTVKNITVIIAVRNIFLLGLCNKYPKEKAMAPRKPPYAIMNWSLGVNFTMRNLLINQVKPRTPRKETENVTLDTYK